MSLSAHFAASVSSAAKASSAAAPRAAPSAAATASSSSSRSPPPSIPPPSPPTPTPPTPRGVGAASARTSIASNDWLFIVSGRTAMLGFAIAAGAELASRHPQPALSDLSTLATVHPLAALALALAVAAGSAAPMLRGEPHDSEAFGPFNARAERANSAVALVGICGLVAVEALKGSALF